MKKIKPRIIAMEAPIAIKAEEGESKGPPSFDVVAYTGGALNLGNFEYPVVVDLKGLELGRSLIANLDHERSKRVGHVTETAKADGKLTLAGKVSAATDAAREVVESAAQGFVWQASIEAMPSRLTEVKAGDEIEVNGQKFTGPLYVAAKSTLKGFAFVSHGADDNTTVSIAASAAQQKGSNMDPKVKAWIESMLPSVDIDSLSAEEVANLEADYAGRGEKRPATVKEPSNPFEKRRLEAARRREIRDIADQFMEENDGQLDVQAIGDIEKMHDHALKEGMTAKDFRYELRISAAPAGHTVRATRQRFSADKDQYADMLTAAVCISCGLSDVEQHFKEHVLDAASKEFQHGISLTELYAKAAEFNGYSGNKFNVTMDMHRYACGAGQAIRAGISTLSLPGILSNVAGKFMLQGWGGGEMTWRAVTAIRPVRDFKQVSSYKLSGHLKYLKVGPGGELKHGTVSETAYTNQAETYGRLFGVSRTDIINDDLGAFTQVPLELGFAANEAFNEVFWAEFLDNGSFFAGGNNNVATGVFGGATSLATLAAAELVFMQQKKPNGTPLGIMPDRILVPNGTYRAALAAMESSLVVGSTGPTPDANTFKGNYSVHTSAYMSNSAYTGYSAVKWYMLANPARLATIETAFLNGREAPIVETDEQPFNVLGIQMRAYHDFGCRKQEYRAGVQGSGAG